MNLVQHRHGGKRMVDKDRRTTFNVTSSDIDYRHIIEFNEKQYDSLDFGRPENEVAIIAQINQCLYQSLMENDVEKLKRYTELLGYYGLQVWR